MGGYKPLSHALFFVPTSPNVNEKCASRLSLSTHHISLRNTYFYCDWLAFEATERWYLDTLRLQSRDESPI